MNYPAPQYPAQVPVQQPVYQQPIPGYAPPVQYAPQPQAPAGPAPAQGSLDDYYSQPVSGGSPGVSWKGKPDGHTYIGTVTRDVVNSDIVQDIDFTTKQPKFYKDQRPVFVMKVPLVNAPTQEFPDGEFTLWVRGAMRDELVRAMAEAKVEGAPKAGDVIQVTLTHRKPNQTGNPTNMFRIVYTPNPNAQAVAAAPSPVAETVQAPAPQPVVQAPVAQAPAAPVQQAAPIAVPAGLDENQQAILNQLIPNG